MFILEFVNGDEVPAHLGRLHKKVGACLVKSCNNLLYDLKHQVDPF